MKVKDLLQQPSRASQREKHLLLSHLLKKKVSELYFFLDEDLPEEIVKEYLRLLSMLENGYPLQYLIGEWDFYGRTFKVEEGLLIPRPETEILVEKCLEKIPRERNILGFDIGIGTGCVSITLLLERKNLTMYGDDVNDKAIKLARINAELYGVQGRFIILKGDMFEPVRGMRFNFVVSNPPYIPQREWKRLPRGVRLEGRMSLIGGEKGYEFYERFSKEVGDFLEDNGFFCLEIGHNQGSVVKELFSKEGFEVMVYKDYTNNDRVVLGWKP
ncbi:MAG: peptide chain release factor N(5)-glutamine methyltransferase [Aquificaceae bacterium]